MNLTKRSRWLTVIAAGIAAWVFFGQKDPDAVEAATAAPVTHPAHAAGPSHAGPPVANLLLNVANRVAEKTAAGSLFAAHSWYVAPPPPPPPVVDTTPVVPPKPVAPPLPYKFIGSYKPDGQVMVLFLTNGDRVYDVHVGDTLENTYHIDSFKDGQLVLTYKPLNEQQQLNTGVDK